MSEKKTGPVVVVAPAGELAEAIIEQAKGPQADETPAEPAGPSATQHTLAMGDRELAYTAEAGTLPIKDAAGKLQAEIFYTSYTLDGVDDPASRPVTFAFNGGPGSSSVWLHMGVFGPRRVAVPDDVAPRPPYPILDNAHTLLDTTDLVFIDPVSTGLSRAAGGHDAKDFHGVKRDVESVGEFIRLWTSRNQRWGSPKFLAGESYGTTRAAGLAAHLQEHRGMFLNGVILISVALDFQTLAFDPGNDLPYVLILPSYTATAHYHGALAGDLSWPECREEVERFAVQEYAPALLRGARLSDDERAAIGAKLARYTGLSEAFIERCDLRVSLFRFAKELLRDQRRTCGRLDSRFQGIDSDAAGEHIEYDPSFSGIMGPYTAAMNHYLRAELGVEDDRIYEILTAAVRPWRFDDAENRYLNVSEPLRKAMSQNPHLKVIVASGWYDLATPYFAADYTIDHLGLDRSLQGNIEATYYPSGHMMYIHEPSLAQLKQDLAAFIAASR